MLKANVGSSTLANAADAGKKAAAAAKVGLGDIKVAFVYASCAYDMESMISGVASELPGILTTSISL